MRWPFWRRKTAPEPVKEALLTLEDHPHGDAFLWGATDLDRIWRTPEALRLPMDPTEVSALYNGLRRNPDADYGSFDPEAADRRLASILRDDRDRPITAVRMMPVQS